MKKEQLDKDNAARGRKVSIGFIVVIISFFAVAISMDTGLSSKITGLVAVGGGCDTEKLKLKIDPSAITAKVGQVLSFKLTIQNEFSNCDEEKITLEMPPGEHNSRIGLTEDIYTAERIIETNIPQLGNEKDVFVRVIVPRTKAQGDKYELEFKVKGKKHPAYMTTGTVEVTIIGGTPVPGDYEQIELKSPIGVIGTSKLNPDFKWVGVKGAECYQIYVEDNENRNDVIINELIMTNLNEWKPKFGLVPGKQYIWHIRAYNWLDMRNPDQFTCRYPMGDSYGKTFSIGDVIKITPESIGERRIKYQCLRPSQIACTTTPNSITLSWNEVQGATKYTIRECIGSSNSCSTTPLTDKISIPYDELPSDTEYTFHVEVSESDDCIAPSPEATKTCRTKASTGTADDAAADEELPATPTTVDGLSFAQQIQDSRTDLVDGWNLIYVTQPMVGTTVETGKTLKDMFVCDNSEAEITGGYMRNNNNPEWFVVMGTDDYLPNRATVDINKFPPSAVGNGLVLLVDGSGCHLNCGSTSCSQ